MNSEVIDQVREGNNIVDVVSAYLPLKRSGTNYKGLCPFHEDRNPSMMVSEAKQIFKCFVCGKGGNVFTFVQEYEKISFIESVKKLAERAGIPIKDDYNSNKVASKRSKIIDAYKLANEHFVSNLKTYGSEIYTYLEGRQISKELADKLSIGYALDSFNGLMNYLKKKGVTDDIALASQLIKSNERSTFDFFRDRVMFPIHSHSGKIVAFGGRKLDDSQPGGKYVNSPTTEIYTKGNELYGLFLTKYDIAKKNYVLVSEGYMDFLRLFTEGFTNSVASLGTALTHEQLRLISRYTKNVYMMYDGDTAGLKSSVNGGLKAVESGLTVLVVSLPKGEDPDSFLLTYGAEKLQLLIDKATPLIRFIKESEGLEKSEKEKIKILMDTALKIKDSIDKELYVKEVGEIFGITQQSINTRLSKSERTSSVAKSKTSFTLERSIEERDFLQYILNRPEEKNNICNSINSDYFFEEIYKKIFISLTKIDVTVNLDSYSQVIDFLDDDSLKNKVAELILMGEPKPDILNIKRDLLLRKLKKELTYISGQIRANGATSELLEKKRNIKNEIQQLDMSIVNNLLT
ncbi:MAG: DNA primase [Candidatus Cloacimonetes bacterium 4572_65]|nr:MAG: DNA primase [Candidatus Cloacimonetes bacterium 4572_65]